MAMSRVLAPVRGQHRGSARRSASRQSDTPDCRRQSKAGPRPSAGETGNRRPSKRKLHKGTLSSKGIWADDLPVIALTKLFALGVVHRAVAMQELLDVAPGGSRGVEKDDSAGLAAAVLPRVRDVAR